VIIGTPPVLVLVLVGEPEPADDVLVPSVTPPASKVLNASPMQVNPLVASVVIARPTSSPLLSFAAGVTCAAAPVLMPPFENLEEIDASREDSRSENDDCWEDCLSEIDACRVLCEAEKELMTGPENSPP
jgi:hypothetical protein